MGDGDGRLSWSQVGKCLDVLVAELGFMLIQWRAI
jgi:hypothetical protein